jgi:hypothetical protein
MRRVSCKSCGAKNEQPAFLSSNTKYTLRFAMQIGELCRAMSIKDVARRMNLDWHTVKICRKSICVSNYSVRGIDVIISMGWPPKTYYNPLIVL